MPQMSPMYWILLLMFTMMTIYMYMSLLYFNTKTPSFTKFSKKYSKSIKKLIF